MAIFVVHAGFYNRVTAKTEAFLITSPTSSQEVTFSYCIFFPFNGDHKLNYFKFLTR